MKPAELVNQMRAGAAPLVVDVRSGPEFRGGHIPGALHAPSWKILLRLARLPADRSARLVVTCEHGPRAQIAAALLGRCGYANVTLLDGHMAGWRRAGFPLEK